MRKAALDEREQRLLQAEADLKVARSEQERAARQLAATQSEAEAARAEAERLQRRAASEAEALESRSAGLAVEASAATEQRLAATAKLRDVEQREEAVFRAEREAAALQARLVRQQAELADKAAALAEAAARQQAEAAAFETQRKAWTDGEAGRRELLAREAELREEAGASTTFLPRRGCRAHGHVGSHTARLALGSIHQPTIPDSAMPYCRAAAGQGGGGRTRGS